VSAPTIVVVPPIIAPAESALQTDVPTGNILEATPSGIAANMIIAISVNPISSSTQNSGTSEIRELLAPISTVSPGTEFEGLDIAMQADPTLELTKNLLAVESLQDTLTGTDIATSLLTGSNPKVALLRQTKCSSVGAVAAMVSGDDSGEGLSDMSGSAE